MQPIISTSYKDIAIYPGSQRTVILLHGFLSSKRYWNGVSRLLSEQGYRVIAIDLLGFGNAAKPKDSRYGYAEHLAHIHKTVQRLNIDEPFILAGHSMGALLAMRFASEYPALVSRLALINPPMYSSPHQAKSTLRATGSFYRLLLDSRYRHILWVILRTIGPFAKHTRYSREGSLANVINLAYFFEDIEKVTIPTLLFVGTKDRKEYLANLSKEGVGENINVVIAETGHHAPKTDADFVVEQLIAIVNTP